jgi:hypothetical protein
MEKFMSIKFKNVIIMGDLIRPWKNGDQSVSGAFRNVQWLCHLVTQAIRSADLPVYALDWNRHAANIEYKRFDVADYYQRKGLEISVTNWSALSNSNEHCPELVAQLSLHLDESLVIGYEMSKMQIATLEHMGVTYIDLVLHPVRFAHDILHAARTNDPFIHSVLKACHFDSSVLYEAAGEIMAKICRIPKTVKTPMDTAVLLGQVWTDRAVSKAEGGFYKLDDFMSEVSSIVNKHAAVIYKPHPYEFVSGDKSQICQAFKSIATSDLNYYILLCQPTVTSVYGLNSSGLYEAKFFGRTADYLIDPQYQFNDDMPGDSVDLRDFLTISEIWTKGKFWEKILKNIDFDMVSEKNTMTKNKLRGSMNTDWGYEKIDKLVVQL